MLPGRRLALAVLGQAQPCLGLPAGPIGGITSLLGGSTFVGGVIVFSGLLPSLRVLVSELSGSVQRAGHPGQDLRELPRSVPRMRSHELGRARRLLRSIQIRQVRPTTFQLRSMALIRRHLTLKLSPPLIALIVPEPGGALVVCRRRLVTGSDVPMVCCRLFHNPPV
jgi:hypothetical protein